MKIFKFSFLSVLLFVLSDCLYAQPRWQMTPPEDPSYTMQEICCTSDGNKIYGEAFMPKAPGKHPAVILSHGYGATHHGFYPLVDTLAKSGYVCYCYDFAGGSPRSQSEGRTEDMSIFSERQNLMDVLAMVRGWDCVDPERVFLLGESQGGCVSAITAPQVAEKIRAILLIYPALCIPDDGFALYPTLADVPETVNFMGMNIGRAYYERFYDGYDIYRDIAGYQGDVLIVHGTEDGLVKPEYSAKASNVYDHCELHLIFKAGHGFWKPEDRALYHEYVLNYLGRHI
jgi:Dipeptidyl aminopeptidases/acylaminoacyl-peptidases